MESRLRNSPSHIFECWCEVVAPQGSNHPPWIIQKFPRTYEDSIIKNVPQFTFPCAFTKKSVEHFSFVLTELDSKFLYGFCRHAPDTESSFVILSHLPWDKLFYKVLNHCSSMSSSSTGDLWTFLKSLYQVPVPAPGEQLTVCYSSNKYFREDCPNHLDLPSIPENRNLNEYFNAVDADNMIVIFASMLNERRIIMTSERLSRLSSCVQAANYLIYPMTWQHIFIPVLPEDLLGYLHAPMPFLIGVSSLLMKKVRHEIGDDLVILNADKNTIESPFCDVDEIPEEVVSYLQKNLKPTNFLLGDNFARTFLKAVVQLIGNYREALTFREEDKCINFDEDKFMSNRPHHFRPFIEKLLQLQLFKQFIEERLQLLNAGLHTSDVFELEASIYEEKSISKVRLMYSSVKKESGAMMLDIKKKVKKHSKNVEKKSKTAYKDIKGKLKDLQQPPTFPDRYPHGNSRAQSAPSSPNLTSHLPDSGYLKGQRSKVVSYRRPTKESEKEIFQSSSMASSSSEKTPSPQSMDLIGEMEIALNTQFGCDKDGYFKQRLSNSSNLDTNSDITAKASLSSSSTNHSSSHSSIDFSQASSNFNSKSELNESPMSKSLMEQDLMTFDSSLEDKMSMSSKELIPSSDNDQSRRVSKVASAYSVQQKANSGFVLPRKSSIQSTASSYLAHNPIYCDHLPPLNTQTTQLGTSAVGRTKPTELSKKMSSLNSFSQAKSVSSSDFSNHKEKDLLGDFSADFANFCVNKNLKS